MVMLATCDVKVRGPGEVPPKVPVPVAGDNGKKRGVESLELRLQEPVYKNQFYSRKEALRYLLSVSGWMCWGCGQSNRRWDGSVLEDTRNFEIDHVDPQASGGAEVVTNWAPLCRGCNGMKGRKEITLRELRRQVVEEGVLMVPQTGDLPDLGKMMHWATEWHADQRDRALREKGLIS